MASSSYFSPSRSQMNNHRRQNAQANSPAVQGRPRRNLLNLVSSRTPNKTASFSAATAPINPRSGGYWSAQSQVPLAGQTQAARHRRGGPAAPRAVTPNSSPSGVGMSPSWDEMDDGSSYSSSRYNNNNNRVYSDRSVASTTAFMRTAGDDMPMDELMDSMSVQSMPPIRHGGHRHRRSNSASISMDHDWSSDLVHAGGHRRNLSMEWSGINSSDLGLGGGGGGGSVGRHRRSHSTSNVSMDWNDDVSSLGGVEDEHNGLGRIIGALRHRSIARPSYLNGEERILWDAIQTAIGSVRNEQISNKRRLERLLQDATRREANMERKLLAAEHQLLSIEGSTQSPAKASQMEAQLRDAEAALKTRQADHERELRAIQRVLAEMSSEREQETSQLNKRIETLTVMLEALKAEQKANDFNNLEQDYEQAKLNLNLMEEENMKLYQEIDPLKNELEDLKEVVADLRQQNQKLEFEVDNSKRAVQTAMTPPRPTTATATQSSDAESVSSEEVESLQRNLSETTSSLENAKKIIASLENASGSLALDLRAKLKAKEQELLAAQNESADCKRRLDILATELRDLQKSNGEAERAEKKLDALCLKQRTLIGQLEKHISCLESASVVHEVPDATGEADDSNVDQIREILNDALSSLKSSLDSSGQYVAEFDSQDNSHADGNDLRVVRSLEDALKKQNEEVKSLRAQLDDRNLGNDQSTQQLQAEVQSLREQCATNIEVLAKKDQELSVLRSSLDVDENDGGYISDDASDGDEEGETATAMSQHSMKYGPADTETIASILSQTEVEKMKIELQKALSEKEMASKDLKTERESLANAKMIISSLETANKSMVEDLRSRLQNSNSAIASLLNKSEETEKNTTELQEEVEKLRKEKNEEQQKYEAEIRKLKGDSDPLVSAPKLDTEEKKDENVVAD